MGYRVKAKYKFSGIMLARIDAALLARFQENPQRGFAFTVKTFNVGGLAISAAVQPRELATEHRNFRVKRNDGLIATYFHHVIYGLKVSIISMCWSG